jgi:hypothetical protein
MLDEAAGCTIHHARDLGLPGWLVATTKCGCNNQGKQHEPPRQKALTGRQRSIHQEVIYIHKEAPKQSPVDAVA